MRKTLLFITLGLVAAACGSEQKPAPAPVKKEQPVIKVKEEEKVQNNGKSADYITDENVIARLTAYGKENPETIVRIHTSEGTITARLYKDTPLHRANFIMIAKKGCLDSTVFTRVAKNFIAQGGGTYNRTNADIRNQIGRYTIPAEISHQHFHKQGALGAARSYEDNPGKRSDRFAFYFVEGTVFNDITLNKYETDNGYKYTAAQREYYLHHPGAAHIDGEHTVFGEIIEGLSVLPKLTSAATDSRDWPIDDLFIKKVEVLR